MAGMYRVLVPISVPEKKKKKRKEKREGRKGRGEGRP